MDEFKKRKDIEKHLVTSFWSFKRRVETGTGLNLIDSCPFMFTNRFLGGRTIGQNGID